MAKESMASVLESTTRATSRQEQRVRQKRKERQRKRARKKDDKPAAKIEFPGLLQVMWQVVAQGE